MNNLRLVLIGLLIPAILMIPYSIFSFYTDFANKNPDPALVTVDFNGITFNAIEGKKTFEQYQCMGCHTIVGNGAYFGPDLTNVYERTGKSDAALSGLMLGGLPSKGMPPMKDRGMDPEDAARTAAFLKYASMLDTNGWPNSGSWERNGSIDGMQEKRLYPAGMWQVILGIVFFNMIVFGVIMAYERRKEEGGL